MSVRSVFPRAAVYQSATPADRTSCRSSLGVNVLGAFRNAITYATLRRAPRGRPDLAGCLPRCVRTGGRVEVCAKSVPTLAEPCTFVKWMLKAAKHATEILLDSVDYFTILLTGISGIFVNNLPLSFSTALAHSSKPPNAKIPGLFRYFFGQNPRNLRT